MSQHRLARCVANTRIHIEHEVGSGRQTKCQNSAEISRSRRTRSLAISTSLIGLAISLAACTPAYSQSSNVVARGDAVVTNFSGAKTPANVPKGSHPLDVTTIDPEGATLRVLDLSNLATPPRGGIATAPTKFSIPAKQIGQVFGVTLDDPDNGDAPNIFTAATSLFNLQIVGKRDGKTIRLVKGEPGAQWMSGQFGTTNGGGPGTIWKINGKTGAVSLFTKIKSGANDNAGPGLGALSYDFVSRKLYVPNLETGFIHGIDMNGKEVSVFDHGTSGRVKEGLKAVGYDPQKRVSIEDPSFNIEKPATWGFADNRRLVVAVAVQSDRLYYSVAEGSQVWSVGLDAEGGFLDDARLETELSGPQSGGMITGIAFDGPGELYLTQRGEMTGSYDYRTFAKPQAAAVVHFSWDEEAKRWSNDSEEFAVGLKPPHRAANGGLALGYGYDKNGSLKPRTCNATLWTTGDNLRDGSSGTSISGLQGNPTSLGQPRTDWKPKSGSSALRGNFDLSDVTVLESPAKSWFIDLGANGEAAAGHVGGLAIYTPYCANDGGAPSSRPEPIVVPEPEISWPDWGPDGIFPPIGFPGLNITKTCAPAAIGGVIKCTITVANTGTLPFIHPITVSDATTIATGPGAGGAMSIASVTPDGAEWTCTPTPSINLSCGLPAPALLPGVSRSFTVDIDTSAMIVDGNVGFTNCASIGAPYWGIACDSAGTDITVQKTAEPGCLAGADCTYKLEIKNNASTPFNGQIQLTDQMFLGAIGGPLNAPVAINGDLGCAGGNPASIPFSCLATMALAAGETRSFDMVATMPAAPPNYWARNCFAATNPGLVPADLATMMPPGGGSLGSGGAVSCAWMQVGVPGPHANLKMKKTAQDCAKIPGDPNTVKCDYTISMTNSGPSDFNTLIAFDETVDPAATLIMNEPGWVCLAGPPTYSCGSAAAVPIATGNTIDIPVSVTTPRNVVEANVCRVPNQVTLTAPAVNPATNYLGADDTATAEGDAFLLEFNLNGAAIILCDPTNLKTTKVAKGPCEEVDPGWRCDYLVDIENTGPDPYKGEIRFIDIMSIAPTSVAYSGTPGWSRTPAIGHDMYTLPQRTIEKGDSVKLDLSVTIPDGEYCSLSNTAHMTFPVLKRHNGDKTDDTATATATIPRPECRKPTQCKPKTGEIRTASGACACEPNATRGKDGVCNPPARDPKPDPKPEPDPEPETPEQTGSTCPDGHPIPRNGICPCERGKTWDKGLKICVGDDYDPPGDVTPEVTPDPVVTPPSCRLLPGQIRDRYDRCVCANGRKWNSRTYCERRRPACKPRIGEIIVRGKCVCPNGRRWNAKTYCARPQQEVCPVTGTYQAAPGVCCLIGQTYRNGKCHSATSDGGITPDTACKRPRFKNKLGYCTCGPNKKYIARYNICVQKTDPAKDCKAKGWTWTGKLCVQPLSPAQKCKKKGWKWTGKSCIKPIDPAKACKEKGWRWVRYVCLPPRSPAKDCKAKGWNWTGKKCVKPLSPAKKCKAKGWRWTGKRCVKPPTPAQKCKAKGWKWTGSRCIKPVTPCPKGTYGPGQPNCKKIILKKKPKAQIQQKKYKTIKPYTLKKKKPKSEIQFLKKN